MNSQNKKAFTTLLAVLIITAIALAVSTSLLLLGLNSSKTSFAIEQSNQAKALANACAETGLQQIRSSTPYVGTGNLTLGNGTCNYTVTNTDGTNRTVTAYGTVGTIIRRISISVTAINPKIIISSWQEIP